MKKEHKIHLIYTAVSILIVVGVLTFDFYTTQQTRALLEQEITSLNSKLNTAEQALKQSIAELQQQDDELESSVTSLAQNLNVEISKKDTQIRALSGELEEVRTESAEQLEELQDKISSLKTEFSDFSDVIEDVIPAVVSVETNVGEGSGFFVDSRGYLVTNYHVISGATAAQVTTSEGSTYPVRIIGFQKNADVAVLKIEETVKALRFASSDSVRVGEKVIALGNPGGLEFTVTQGIVSALDRDDSKGNEYVQIDVPINPGNSGGPLVNTDGRVIGVNTLKISGFEGLGFALEADLVKAIVNQVIAADTG